MFPARRNRPLIWLALFAWLAQLCLPAAHASMMAETGLGSAAWCGSASPGMQAKLAQLPQDVRRILEDAGAQSGHLEDCAQACGAIGGAGAAPEPVTLALRAADPESAAMPAFIQPQARRSAPPPARGPPMAS